MIRRASRLLVFLAAPLLIAGVPALIVATPAEASPNCKCRYYGAFYRLGTEICIRTSKGSRVARCKLELNNTSWKVTKRRCRPVAQSQPVILGIPRQTAQTVKTQQ